MAAKREHKEVSQPVVSELRYARSMRDARCQVVRAQAEPRRLC